VTNIMTMNWNDPEPSSDRGAGETGAGLAARIAALIPHAPDDLWAGVYRRAGASVLRDLAIIPSDRFVVASVERGFDKEHALRLAQMTLDERAGLLNAMAEEFEKRASNK
jgi:hypothetical protein